MDPSFFHTFTSAEINGQRFTMFCTSHIIAVIVIISILICIHIFKEQIKQLDTRKIEIVMGSIMVIQQISMYTWYIYNQANLVDSLPLYVCRITIIVTGISFIIGTERNTYLTYYWGTMGGILALLFPDTSGYNFPHMLYFSYFVGHGMLMISIVYFHQIKEHRTSKEELKRMLIVNFIYIAAISLVNIRLNSNYNYTSKPPYMFSLPMWFVKSLFYKLGILIIFDLIAYLIYLPQKRRDNISYEVIN